MSTSSRLSLFHPLPRRYIYHDSTYNHDLADESFFRTASSDLDLPPVPLQPVEIEVHSTAVRALPEMFPDPKTSEMNHSFNQFSTAVSDMDLPWSTTDTSASSSQDQSSQIDASSQDEPQLLSHPQGIDLTMAPSELAIESDRASQLNASVPVSPINPRGALTSSSSTVGGATWTSLPTSLEDQYLDFNSPPQSASRHHHQVSQDSFAASYASFNNPYGSISAPDLLDSTDTFEEDITMDQGEDEDETDPSGRPVSAAGSAHSTTNRSTHSVFPSSAQASPTSSKKSSVGPHRQKSRHKCDRHQFDELTAFFAVNRNPVGKVREDLAKRLDMPERSVQIWFQNKRARKKDKARQQLMRRGVKTVQVPEALPRAKIKAQGDKEPATSRPRLPQVSSSGQSKSNSSRSSVPSSVSASSSAPSKKASSKSSVATDAGKSLLIIPSTSVVIGSWRRIRPLTCVLSHKSRSLSWNLISQSVGFKIDVPWTSIHEITFNGPTNPSLSEQAEGNTEPLGILCVKLFKAPTFFMETFRSSVKQEGGAGDGEYNRWRQCDDFTEARQGTYILCHLVSGPYQDLRQAVLQMAAADPDLALKLRMLDTPTAFTGSAEASMSMQQQQQHSLSSVNESGPPSMIRQESYRSAAPSIIDPSPQSQTPLLPAGFDGSTGFAPSSWGSSQFSHASMPEMSPFATMPASMPVDASVPNFGLAGINDHATGAAGNSASQPSFGGALHFDPGMIVNGPSQSQPQQQRSATMMPSMTQPLPSSFFEQRPTQGTAIQRRSYDHYLQQQRQQGLQHLQQQGHTWFGNTMDGSSLMNTGDPSSSASSSNNMFDNFKRHSDSVLAGWATTSSPSTTHDLHDHALTLSLSPLVASFGEAALSLGETASSSRLASAGRSVVKSSLDGAVVSPSLPVLEGVAIAPGSSSNSGAAPMQG